MKNIIFYVGTLTIVTTLGCFIFNKIDLTTVGILNSTILGILYGWYQKLSKDEVVTQNLILEEELMNTSGVLTQTFLRINELARDLKEKDEDHLQELKAYQLTVENLRKGFDSEKLSEVKSEEVCKPKRTRKPKK